MARIFLTAEWRDLIIASYAIHPDLLAPRLPEGLELDLFEGKAVCSLVGFRFLNTRVLGVRWPGYQNFPEINLRFYVRETSGERRGVVFIRELVKHWFVAKVARSIYNEPYVKAKISELIETDQSQHAVQYRFQFGGGYGTMNTRSSSKSSIPDENSTEHWFKEHQWGYGKTRRGKTIRYEVQHPYWACHEVFESAIDVDWGRIYGEQFAHMNHAKPLSVVLAQGSEIKVFGANRMTAR